MNRTPLLLAVFAVVGLLGVASDSLAATITLSTIGRGRYSSTANNGGGPSNVFGAGWFDGDGLGPGGPDEWRSWFRFGVGGVSGTVTSANLIIQNSSISYAGGASETYLLRQITTSFPLLGTGSPSAGTVFTDLGDGALYGSRVFTAADNGTTTSIALSAAALAGIQEKMNGVGMWALSGYISTLAMSGTSPETVGFGVTSNAQLQLIGDDLQGGQIPEPATLGLLAAGVCAIAIGRSRRRAK